MPNLNNIADKPTHKINDVIDRAISRKHQSEVARDYLGASLVGGKCKRAIQYAYQNTPKDPIREFQPRTLRMFQDGHAGEDMTRQWLIDAGFEIAQGGAFTQLDGRFKGHIDGRIIGSPVEVVKTPCLWEHKRVGNKTWKEIISKGILARPTYAAQVAIYQAYCGLHEHPALFTMTNRDTLELYHILVPFDKELAQSASDVAGEVIDATTHGETIARGFASETNFECRFCAWQDRCWERK